MKRRLLAALVSLLLLSALPSGFSDSLIPAPAKPVSLHDQQSRVTPARRSPA